MKLTDRFDDTLFYKNEELHIDLMFDVVLRAEELLSDDRFEEYEKADILFNMFVIDAEQYDFDLREKNEIVQTIFRDMLGNEEPQEQSQSEETEQPAKDFDFEEDAEYIYASFLQDYQMDLYKQQGKLHWNKFMALISGLSEKTKFSEVLSIRNTPMSEINKMDKAQKENMMKKKRAYALKNNGVKKPKFLEDPETP